MQRRLRDFWPLDKQATHTFLVFGALVIIFLFVIFLKNVFTPFFIALLLAYILNPLVNFGERFSVPRWLSTFTVFTFFSLTILLFLMVIVPSFIQEFNSLTEKNNLIMTAPFKLLEVFKGLAQEHLAQDTINKITKIVHEWAGTLQASSSLLKDTSLSMGKTLLRGISFIPARILNLFLIPFYLFFSFKFFK